MIIKVDKSVNISKIIFRPDGRTARDWESGEVRI